MQGVVLFRYRFLVDLLLSKRRIRLGVAYILAALSSQGQVRLVLVLRRDLRLVST